MIPDGKAPVIVVVPPSMNLKRRLACFFSWLEVSSKTRDI